MSNPHSTPHDHLIRLVMVGDSNVGKSCVLLRLADKTFNDNYMTTIGVDFRFHLMEVDNRHVKLQVWDTAGQERFRTITTAYYKGADGIIMVYDITKKDSFEHIEYWASEIERNSSPSTVKMLIGNKSDLEDSREVSFEDGQALANSMGVQFFETSAKEANNIVDAYMAITREVLKKYSFTPDNKAAVDVSDKPAKNSKCC